MLAIQACSRLEVMSWQNWKQALPSLFLLQVQFKDFDFVRLHASLVLFLVLVNFCVTQKENCCHSCKLFPLQMKCFLIFAKVFYAKFVPKINIRESFCQKFRDFLNSRKFLPLKYICNSKYLKAKRKLIITGMIDLCQNQFAIFPILQDLIFCLWKLDSG